VVKHRARANKAGGFSRLETTAVLGVAGLGAVLVLPGVAQANIIDWLFGRPRLTAARANCQSNLKQLGLGLLQYTQDYDEMYTGVTSDRDSYGWAAAIEPYIKSRETFVCPLDKGANATAKNARTVRQRGYTDYWYNRALSRRQVSAVVDPPFTITMGDGDGRSKASDARYSIAALPKSWTETKGSPARRHEEGGAEGANYCYADGHVKFLTPKAVGTLPVMKARESGLAATFCVK
jgi:prepilin-type processing-associated H-X9-DG protein